MAVDTRDRRASVIGFAVGIWALAPNPDGSLAVEADRRQMAWTYPGFSTGGAGSGAGRIRRARGKVYMPKVNRRGRL